MLSPVAFVVALALVAAACGSDEPAVEAGGSTDSEIDGPEEQREDEEENEETNQTFDSPPPLLVVSEGASVELETFGYCWSGGGGSICADGQPSEPLPVFPADQPLRLSFPIAGWEFSASALSICESGSWSLTAIGDTEWLLEADGVAGRNELMIFGRGPQGDAAYALAFESAGDGSADSEAATAPRGTLQLLNLADPEQSGDLIVGLEGPAEVLDIDSIKLEITGSSPEVFDIDLNREMEGRSGDCYLSRMVSGQAAGDAAAVTGDPPWTYTVTVITNDDQAFEAVVTQESESIPAGHDDAVAPLVFRPIDLPAIEEPDPPTDLGVPDADVEAAVRQFLALLADGEYQAAANAAIKADFDTDNGVMQQPIADGLVTAGVGFPEQLRQWCTVATCTEPESIEVQSVGESDSESDSEFGSGFDVLATWADGSTAEFEVATLEGLNVLGLPPRQ